MEKKKTFLEIHQQGIETLGFWSEDYRSILILSMEIIHRQDIIREWGISDIIINGDKVLLKWYKRIVPLSDEELKKKFGK